MDALVEELGRDLADVAQAHAVTRRTLAQYRETVRQMEAELAAAKQERDSTKRAFAELLKINGALHRNVRGALGSHAHDGLSLAENVAELVRLLDSCTPDCKERRRVLAESAGFRADVVEGKRILLDKPDVHKKHPTGDHCTFCNSQWPCEEAPEDWMAE